jgi:hypothetical protein
MKAATQIFFCLLWAGCCFVGTGLVQLHRRPPSISRGENTFYPNNLPGNAHGNGYADPNFLISRGIGTVQAEVLRQRDVDYNFRRNRVPPTQ